MIDRYLEPLKEETFMSTDDVDHLFGNIHEISQFQKQFLQSLEEAMQLEGDFLAIEDPKLFRVNIHLISVEYLNKQLHQIFLPVTKALSCK